MSTALEVRHEQTAALAIRPGQTDWDKYQAAALAQIGLKDASNADRAVFLHQCQRTGLDPFSKQIYMIPRNEKQRDGSWGTKWTIQTGIDGWRVIRDRAERRAGVRGTLGRAVWYDHEGNEFKVWVRRDPPAACEITYTVRDATGETPYTSVLQFAGYVQTNKDGDPIAQWATKGPHMLEKCTEADVYRKAFPQDFAGISLDDAMPPAEDMTDEQLDAAYAKTTRRVTAADIRGHTRPMAHAEIVDDTPDASPAETQTETADAPAPLAPSAGEAPDENRPPPRATTGQVNIIRGHFTRLGFDLDDQDDGPRILDSIAQLAGLDDITSLGDLDQERAARVIKWLVKCDKASDLEKLLTDGTMPGA